MKIQLWVLSVSDRNGTYANIHAARDDVTEFLVQEYGTEDSQQLADLDVFAEWDPYVIDTKDFEEYKESYERFKNMRDA